MKKHLRDLRKGNLTHEEFQSAMAYETAKNTKTIAYLIVIIAVIVVIVKTIKFLIDCMLYI